MTKHKKVQKKSSEKIKRLPESSKYIRKNVHLLLQAIPHAAPLQQISVCRLCYVRYGPVRVRLRTEKEYESERKRERERESEREREREKEREGE